MVPLRNRCLLIVALISPLLLSGCQRVMHNLHPERLWRLNRGPAVGVVDSTFSISDDEATERAGEWRDIVREQAE